MQSNPLFVFGGIILRQSLISEIRRGMKRNEGSTQGNRLMRYSMQLLMLQKLQQNKLISEREYKNIKERLMKD